MRQIKLRAWHAEYKSMVYDLNSISLFHGVLQSDDYILMQYTGFVDKDGVEIYYDDIAYTGYGSKAKVTDIIVAHWIIEVDKMNYPLSRVQVIGNIYEHPNLLW